MSAAATEAIDEEIFRILLWNWHRLSTYENPQQARPALRNVAEEIRRSLQRPMALLILEQSYTNDGRGEQ